MKKIYIILLSLWLTSCFQDNYIRFAKESIEKPDSVFVWLKKYDIKIDSNSKNMRDWVIIDSNYRVIDRLKFYKFQFSKGSFPGIDGILSENDYSHYQRLYTKEVILLKKLNKESNIIKTHLGLVFRWTRRTPEENWTLYSIYMQ